MDNAATHDAGSLPELGIRVAGNVPNPLPTRCSFSATIKITIRIKLF